MSQKEPLLCQLVAARKLLREKDAEIARLRAALAEAEAQWKQPFRFCGRPLAECVDNPQVFVLHPSRGGKEKTDAE